MGVFFEKRRTPFIVMALSYLFLFTLTSIVFLLWNIPLISIATNYITLFIITLNYESSIIKRLAATLGTSIIVIVAEAIAFFSTGFYHANVLDTVGVYNALSFILLGVLSYIFALFFRRLKNIRKSTTLSPIFLIFYSTITVSTFIAIIFAWTYAPWVVGLITTFIIFGINIFMYYTYDVLAAVHEEKLKSALHTQEKEYYFTQCQLMQESVEQMKMYRHDVKFHLATLNDFAIKDNADNVIKYLNSLFDNIGKKEIYSDTGNIAFDSIINFKLKTAAEDNVKLDIDVFVPPKPNIEIADVVTILGNLLDNAIDGVSKVEDKIIKLNIEARKGNLFIKIENTFDGLVKYAKGKDGATEAITTRKRGDNHGYGLKNIRIAAGKYNGRVDISHEDNVFSVAVLLYLDEM